MAKSVGKPELVQISVRLPKSLKSKLEESARNQELTVTDVIIQALRKAV